MLKMKDISRGKILESLKFLQVAPNLACIISSNSSHLCTKTFVLSHSCIRSILPLYIYLHNFKEVIYIRTFNSSPSIFICSSYFCVSSSYSFHLLVIVQNARFEFDLISHCILRNELCNNNHLKKADMSRPNSTVLSYVTKKLPNPFGFVGNKGDFPNYFCIHDSPMFNVQNLFIFHA